MRKTLLSVFIGCILLLSFAQNAKATEAKYKESIGFENKYVEAYEFEHTNGNERLRLKELADIERASATTVHYDYKAKEHYTCSWKYNEVLGRWVCGKDYEKAIGLIKSEPVTECPYGYVQNMQKNGCVKKHVPDNAHMNNEGTGWQCDPGYHLNSSATGCVKDQSTYVPQPIAPIPPKPCTGKCGNIVINNASTVNIYQAETINIMQIGQTSGNSGGSVIVEDGAGNTIPSKELPPTGAGLLWTIISSMGTVCLWGVKKIVLG